MIATAKLLFYKLKFRDVTERHEIEYIDGTYRPVRLR